jgi:outer membrane lipoprotein SlyB
MFRTIPLLLLTSALSLGACDTFDRHSDRSSTSKSSSSKSTASSAVSGVGTVTSIDVVKGDDPGLAGALIGAVAGGVVGSQIGGGKGKTLATIAGTVGGAVVGREVQRRHAAGDQVYKVTVLMENGRYQTIAMDSNPNVEVGERVRIDGGVVYRYSSR